MKLSITLNGAVTEADVEADALLLDVIRGLGHTDTKEGCGVGVCGACTVLVDDLPVASCISLAPCAEGAQVWTAEGLTDKDPRLLDAFVEHEGLQCGICTPGQVVSAYALRLDDPAADEERIRCHMAGNLCRCTGYATITESVRAYLAAQ
jgi:aerobic-type carbon monoxide dehydrogenase small subunit (CoxS/CutS family)